MTNFRYSQNPRVARKRPSRTSRTVARRRFSDNRYRERSEIHRSARRNKRANLTLTPSDITWVAREREPGFFWVEGTDSEGYHYGQGLVPASSAREAIEEMESGYQFSLRRGNRNRRANRPVRRIATNVPDWAVDNDGDKLVVGQTYQSPSDLYPQPFVVTEYGTKDLDSGEHDSWDDLKEFLLHEKSPGVIKSSKRANRRANRRASHDYSVADAVAIARDIYDNASADLIEAIEILWVNPYSTLLNQHVANELERRGDYHITDFPSIPAILSGIHAGQSDQEIINLIS